MPINARMAPLLGFDECVKDSPTFRELLHHAEADTLTLENLLEKVSKQCSIMNEAERSYNAANELLKQVLQDLGEYYNKDNFLMDVIGQFVHVLSEINSFHMILDQAQRSINQKMTHFLKFDVKGNQDLKKVFDKASNEYDNALSKHAAVSRFKPHEIEESENSVVNHKTAFRKVAMEYVFQINMLHKNKRTCTISQMTSFMHALQTYFHQGFELFKDMEPFFKKNADQLDKVSSEIESEKSDMITQRERYQAMAGDNSMFVKEVESSSSSIVEGYLFKRASNAFKTWSRRWFSVHNNQLLYQSKIKAHHQEVPIVIVEDLRLCSIRVADDVERRFCFEVISPSKSFLLQAESEDVRQAWVHAIQSSIQEAYKTSMEKETVKQQNEVSKNLANNGLKSIHTITHSSSSPALGSHSSVSQSTRKSPSEESIPAKQTVLQRIMEIPGNTSCADCKKHEARWASVNLGIVLCIECSGVHRSLGVHISKVRSLTLDSWDPEVIAIMQSLGNDRVNEVYEARIGLRQIKPGSSNKDRADFIQAKYVRREFCALLPNETSESAIPGKKIRRWKIRKSKSKRKREKRQKADSLLQEENDASTNQENQNNTTTNVSGDKADQAKENDVFVFGESKIPDPDGETEVENSDIEDIVKLDSNLLFFKAAKLGTLPVMLLAKANSADINWHNCDDEQKTPLMQAAIGGSIRACEYLLINGAKINAIDANGRTALHYAAIRNHTGIACQFLKRKANHGIADKGGETPLDIAIEAANADIVTLIRLKQMNDEMMDTDPGSAQTDTLVTDVFRDFSHRAAINDLSSPDGSVSPMIGSPISPNFEDKSALEGPTDGNENGKPQDIPSEGIQKENHAPKPETEEKQVPGNANSNNNHSIFDQDSVLPCESTV